MRLDVFHRLLETQAEPLHSRQVAAPTRCNQSTDTHDGNPPPSLLRGLNRIDSHLDTSLLSARIRAYPPFHTHPTTNLFQDRYPPGIGGFTSTSVTLSPLSKILYSAQSDSKESISSIIKTLRAHEANLLTRERDLDLRAANLTAVIHRSTRPTSLVSYVYTESPTNRRNLEFFIAHGLHGSADFVFTFNGETDAHLMLPIYPESPFYQKFKEKGYSLLNIEVLFRDNKCYDMGAHGSALLRTWYVLVCSLKRRPAHLLARIKETKCWRPMGGGGTGHPIIEDEETFMSRYDRFILMNASIRGPFMPVWSHDCWTEAFWSLLSKKKKLVGMTYNCYGDNPGDGKGHVQSMVWATDARGIRELMRPDHEGGIGYWCPVEVSSMCSGFEAMTNVVDGGRY